MVTVDADSPDAIREIKNASRMNSKRFASKNVADANERKRETQKTDPSDPAARFKKQRSMLAAQMAMLDKKISQMDSKQDNIHECEVVYFDEHGNELLDEAAVRQFKKVGEKLVKKFRCLSGPKAGKLVSNVNACGQRKDPKKVKNGRAIMRRKGAIIARKGMLAKKKAGSKRVAALNKRISGG